MIMSTRMHLIAHKRLYSASTPNYGVSYTDELPLAIPATVPSNQNPIGPAKSGLKIAPLFPLIESVLDIPIVDYIGLPEYSSKLIWYFGIGRENSRPYRGR